MTPKGGYPPRRVTFISGLTHNAGGCIVGNMKRKQRPKTENKAWMEAKNEHLRSNVAVPHRNKAKYRRADWRNAAQRGMVDA